MVDMSEYKTVGLMVSVKAAQTAVKMVEKKAVQMVD